MTQVTLGATGITVNKNGFGALPIQRIGRQEAGLLLRKAYDNGMDFYDTARFYTDSEEKIGYALSDIRNKIIIATKTMTPDAKGFWEQLNTSLKMLKTDYLDIYQFHNPGFCPKPEDGTGLYEAMLEAKEKGMIRHIGITNHRIKVALEAAESGLYETIQFPFNYLATDEEIALVKKCKDRAVGFIAMKALSGGLITDSATAYAYLAQYDNVLPIWGIQREKELDEFISYMMNPPILDEKISGIIERDRKELSGEFCRGCGYCLPCPSGIEIPVAARMSLLLKRAPTAVYLSDEWKAKMEKVDECTHCDHCKNNCPYGLDTPELLARNRADYKNHI
ncbi:MAG: aldo/keto reductase [Saccharofermentanales bacterium]